ncbi:MAG: hypothetical protein U5L11_07555 [Arhodomonas sp.]|nr:hypothetical protein [Arhodomonas sp.]
MPSRRRRPGATLRRDDENDWHTGEDIRLLASLAALLHDLGKATAAFQARLHGRRHGVADRYRHEWISLRLFEAFVGGDGDEAWLQRLARLSADDQDDWLKGLLRDGLDDAAGAPFPRMPPLAAAIGWLVVQSSPPSSVAETGTRPTGFRSDHLETFPSHRDGGLESVRQGPFEEKPDDYWRFEHRLPVATERWRRRAHHLAERLLRRLNQHCQPWLDNPYLMHIARMSLMLADHHYSSLTGPDARLQWRIRLSALCQHEPRERRAQPAAR